MARRRTSWADVPMNCRENVLLRISWCDVCCLRAVSKQWKSDLEDPIFRPGSSCVLTVPRRLMPSGTNPQVISIETHPWQFLEIATNKVFYAHDTFITKALQLRPGIRHTMAASGGFIYTVYDDATHVVCNLMNDEHRQIPAPTIYPSQPHLSALMVVVDAVTQHYKITLMACSRPMDGLGFLDVNVYDSIDKAWRYIYESGALFIPYQSLILDNILYVVCQPRADNQFLYFKKLDLNTNRQTVAHIWLPQVPSCLRINLCSSQVVVASGCLFLVEYSKRSVAAETIMVTIWKIALGKRTVTQVAHLPKFTTYVADSLAACAPVVAVGCEDSIVVSSFCGRRWRWDVGHDSWHEMERFLAVEPLTDCHSLLVAPFDIEMR